MNLSVFFLYISRISSGLLLSMYVPAAVLMSHSLHIDSDVFQWFSTAKFYSLMFVTICSSLYKNNLVYKSMLLASILFIMLYVMICALTTDIHFWFIAAFLLGAGVSLGAFFHECCFVK